MRIFKVTLIIISSIISALLAHFIYQKLNTTQDNSFQQNAPNVITNINKNTYKIGGDFELVHHDGKRFKFSSVNGKPSLIYFGFTHCPDFCPTSLQVMDAVSEKQDINRLFITLDPVRDTQQILSNYVSLYKKGLIGLTGTSNKIDELAKKWNVFYSYNKKDKNDMDYIVDHSTYLYLTDKNGNVIALFRPEATPDEIDSFIKLNIK